MTLLIKNVQIVGAAQTYPEGMDLFVNDDKISAIGKFSNKNANIVLDGQGAYLSPGFIDVNSASDHYLTLFDYPSQEDFLRQGVTTIMGGMCGSSLAPLLYGGLESFQKWGDTNRVNVNWHTMQEFLNVLSMRPLSVNFGTLAGHSTIRRAMIGESLRELTKNELGVFVRTLTTALKEGAFGMSAGLGYVHARKASYSELKTLAEAVKMAQGVYTVHLRETGSGIKASVEEIIRLVKDTGVSALISHFVPVIGCEQEYQEALALIEGLPPEVNLQFDIYPSSSSLHPIYTFLPQWAQTGGISIMAANILDQWLVPRIKKEIPEINEDDFVVAQAPGNDIIVGKSLRELKEMYALSDSKDALLRLMQTTKLKGTILYRNLNFDVLTKALGSKRSFIASNAPSFGDRDEAHRRVKSERTTSTFMHFLSLVNKHNLMPFAEAIRKITLAPAKKFGIVGRGEIKEGNFADLVCFKSDGVKFTVVNGKVAEKEGIFQNVFSGEVLRHRMPK